MDSVVSSCQFQTVQFHRSLEHQLSCVLDMIHIARKMRVNFPETSRLAIQTLGGTGSPTSSTEQSLDTSEASPDWNAKPAAGTPFPRRYSKAQGEEAEDTFNTDEILHKFNSTMVLHHYRNKSNNLYESSMSDDEGSSSLASQPFMSHYLKRRVSASDISKLKDTSSSSTSSLNVPASPLESSNSNPNLLERAPAPGLISRYLGRRGSAGNVLAAISRGAIGSNDSSSSADTKDRNSTLVKSSSSSALATHSAVSHDVTDGLSTDTPSTAGSGFGILSKTRQFGAWLTKATEGEQIEVSRTDLNTVAPTTF